MSTDTPVTDIDDQIRGCESAQLKPRLAKCDIDPNTAIKESETSNNGRSEAFAPDNHIAIASNQETRDGETDGNKNTQYMQCEVCSMAFRSGQDYARHTSAARHLLAVRRREKGSTIHQYGSANPSAKPQIVEYVFDLSSSEAFKLDVQKQLQERRAKSSSKTKPEKKPRGAKNSNPSVVIVDSNTPGFLLSAKGNSKAESDPAPTPTSGDSMTKSRVTSPEPLPFTSVQNQANTNIADAAKESNDKDKKHGLQKFPSVQPVDATLVQPKLTSNEQQKPTWLKKLMNIRSTLSVKQAGTNIQANPASQGRKSSLLERLRKIKQETIVSNPEPTSQQDVKEASYKVERLTKETQAASRIQQAMRKALTRRQFAQWVIDRKRQDMDHRRRSAADKKRADRREEASKDAERQASRHTAERAASRASRPVPKWEEAEYLRIRRIYEEYGMPAELRKWQLYYDAFPNRQRSRVRKKVVELITQWERDRAQGFTLSGAPESSDETESSTSSDSGEDEEDSETDS